MRFAYADPPYLGCGKLYDRPEWDALETHVALIRRLVEEYPDGWALSASAPSLRHLWPHLPAEARECVWTKSFAAFKRNVRVAYTWEPVVVCGGRVSSSSGARPTRDHLREPIAMERGLTGAKPARFCRWVLDLLGYVEGDQVDDLYPGTGIMAEVLAQPLLQLR